METKAICKDNVSGYIPSEYDLVKAVKDVLFDHQKFEFEKFYKPFPGDEYYYKAEYTYENIFDKDCVAVDIHNKYGVAITIATYFYGDDVQEFYDSLAELLTDLYVTAKNNSEKKKQKTKAKAEEKSELKTEAKADAGKPQLSLAPINELWKAVARVREFGVQKYEKNNWKTVEVERYYDALYRHIGACLDDPHAIDSESGLPHMWHVACNLSFIMELDKELQDANRTNNKKN